MEISTREKLLRVQGNRSRNGCETCKGRHVKCDEAFPNCLKCTRAKKVCVYRSRMSHRANKFVVYTLPQQPALHADLTPIERRALWHFQYRTIEQLAGPFPSELWSKIVLRLVEADAIVCRSVLALSTLHECYLDGGGPDASLVDLSAKYQREAQGQIIALRELDESFDFILCASIIFAAYEALLGHFDIATKHALAGMRMIAGQSRPSSRRISILNSEDLLADIFLRLQNQVMEANDDEFQMSCPRLERHTALLPTRFSNVVDAWLYQQALTAEFLELCQITEDHHAGHGQPWAPSQVSPVLKAAYHNFRARCDQWIKAFAAMGVSCKTSHHRIGHLLLQSFAKSFEIEHHVYLHGEATYDDMRNVNLDILEIVKQVLTLQSVLTDDRARLDSSGQPSANLRHVSFTSSPQVIPLLFEIATRTMLPELRDRAIELLRSSSWREGIWDSLLTANLAEQIIELKLQGNMTALLEYPGFKFLVTDILPISEHECQVNYGFKRERLGSFDSFWLESIDPEEGVLQSRTLKLSRVKEI